MGHSGQAVLRREKCDAITWSIARQQLVNTLRIPETLLDNGYTRNNGRTVGHGVICAVHTKVMQPDHQYVADRVV
jgi:hypothetical protein